MSRQFPFIGHKISPFRDEFPELRAALPSPEHYVEIRIPRTLFIALLVSFLLHLLAMFWLHWRTPVMAPPASQGSEGPLNVELMPSRPAAAPTPQTPSVPTRIEHQTVRPQRKPAHVRQQHILTAPGNHGLSLPPPHPVPTPPAPAETSPTAIPGDMSSYINMMRARKRAMMGEAGGGGGETPKDARMANIQRNLQGQGGGGIFQITRMSDDSATFIFRGWDNATWSSPSLQTFTVEADAHSDIEHAIVRKMIAIIRKRHPDTFEWESQRLGQTITLSARPEDNAGLEDFLIKEFFYDNGGH